MMTPSLTRVAFIDDDADVRVAIAQTLRLAGLEPLVFAGVEEALRVVGADFAGVVVSDVRMPRIDGLELHRRLHALDPELPVLLITGHGAVEDAVRAIRSGAYDFITKPFSTERLLISVHRALAFRALVLDKRRLSAALAEPEPDVPILGESPGIVQLRAMIPQLALAETHILIEGEAGAGKEHIARILHQASRRRGRFSVIECAATPDAQLNEELYGAPPSGPGLKGRVGRIEAAQDGTLFLHDLDRASPALQSALARVLEERVIPLPDASDVRAVSFRAIGVASPGLGERVKQGAFRPDLFYSLSMVRLAAAPLRERRGDIPLLFATFQAEAARRLQRAVPEMTEPVRRHLIDHDWPGNMRELQHFAEGVVLGLGAMAAGGEGGMSLAERVNRFEETVIRDALRAARGDVRSALASLKIPRKTFYDKIARHRIDIDEYRAGMDDASDERG